MTDKATPRPWTTDHETIRGPGGTTIVQIIYPTWYRVVDWPELEPCEEDFSAEANAELIIRAVNSHDALVEALEEALEFVDSYVDVIDGPEGQPRPNKAMRLEQTIRAALERAKGDK